MGVLDDVKQIRDLLTAATAAAEATLVELVVHQFAPQGVSGVAVLQESHLSLHTWPEAGYVAVDIFTCGRCRPEQAHGVLTSGLGAQRSELMVVKRGRRDGPQSMVVDYHDEPRGHEDLTPSPP